MPATTTTDIPDGWPRKGEGEEPVPQEPGPSDVDVGGDRYEGETAAL